MNGRPQQKVLEDYDEPTPQRRPVNSSNSFQPQAQVQAQEKRSRKLDALSDTVEEIKSHDYDDDSITVPVKLVSSIKQAMTNSKTNTVKKTTQAPAQVVVTPQRSGLSRTIKTSSTSMSGSTGFGKIVNTRGNRPFNPQISGYYTLIGDVVNLNFTTSTSTVESITADQDISFTFSFSPQLERSITVDNVSRFLNVFHRGKTLRFLVQLGAGSGGSIVITPIHNYSEEEQVTFKTLRDSFQISNEELAQIYFEFSTNIFLTE